MQVDDDSIEVDTESSDDYIQVEVMEMATAMVVAMELVGKESRALLGV